MGAKSGESLNGVPGNLTVFINHLTLTFVHLESVTECDPYSATIGLGKSTRMVAHVHLDKKFELGATCVCIYTLSRTWS